jgi:hypothetical protein
MDTNKNTSVDPGGSPYHLGALTTLGISGDRSMTYDRVEKAIYFFEHETIPSGRVVKLSTDPP